MPTTPGNPRRVAPSRSTTPATVRAQRATTGPVTTDTAAPTPTLADLLSTAEVGQRLGVSSRTVRRWIAEDRVLPGYRVGREYRVDPRHLAAFLASSFVPAEVAS